jgi:riboflavin biosynthesis pyrimidine reductase
MRQLLPSVAGAGTGADDLDVDDLAERYGADERSRPDGRPWVLANMIASADGAAHLDGRTGGMAGPADRAAFTAIRGVADVIVAAAGTVRAENYRPPRAPAEAVARGRQARGQAPRPRLAVVTRRMDLDPDAAIFSDPDQRPLVFTGATADPDRRAAIAEVADVVELGGDGVDLVAMVAWLGEHGARVVLTEGGPSLLGQLVAQDLVDELCLTLAPLLVAGRAERIAHTPDDAVPSTLTLDRVLEADGELLLRYVRR